MFTLPRTKGVISAAHFTNFPTIIHGKNKTCWGSAMPSSTTAEAGTGAGLSFEIEFGLELSLEICSKCT